MISLKKCREYASYLSTQTGIDFEIEYNSQGSRLVCNKQSTDVSPRLPVGQLLMWMNAFWAGYYEAKTGNKK